MNQQSDVVNENNKKIVFFYYMIFFSIAVSAYTLAFNENYNYNMLWILPFVYFMFTSIFFKIIRSINYNFGVVFIAANIIIFVRYVITPFSIVYLSAYEGLGFGPDPTKSSMDLAISLMAVELVAVYFVLVWAMLHYSKKKKNVKILETSILSRKIVVTLFIIITFPLVILTNPDFLLPNSISSIGEGSENFDSLGLDGLFSLLVPMLRLTILLLILSVIKKYYDRNKNGILIIVAWVLVFSYLGMLISTSRWIIVFSSIVCMLIMAYMFPKTPKIFYMILISVTLVIFASISIYKFTWALDSSQNPYRDIINVLFGQFQEYFSGPRVVAQSFDMIKSFQHQISMSTFLNDFLGSVPLISNYIDQSNRINVYFNLYLSVGNVTHIIPMIGNGYAYFPYFPFVFMLIAQWLVVMFDYKSKYERNIEFKYIYTYMGLFFAMSMGFNVQIIFGNFLMYFLLPWILFYLNYKISVKKQLIN